jgi:probable phosphoglycerate mutase
MNIKPSSLYNIQVPIASLNIFNNYDNNISLCGINIMDIRRFITDY